MLFPTHIPHRRGKALKRPLGFILAMLVKGIWPDEHVRMEEGVVERKVCGTMSALI
jgi:hypothetical protein